MAQISLEGSRLVRFLNDLVVSSTFLFDKGFAERISQRIGLQQSLELSGLQGRLATLLFEPRDVDVTAVQQEFIRVNQGLLESIVESFKPGSGNARVQFPGTRLDAKPEQLHKFELYSQFYEARQREIDRSYQHLLSYTRDAASGLSSRLAQLVMLESGLSEALAGYDKQCLAKIPKLLAGHFKALSSVDKALSPESKTSGNEGGAGQENIAWVQQFAADMQGLLLAELEFRLMPVLGLLEAIMEEPEHSGNAATE